MRDPRFLPLLFLLIAAWYPARTQATCTTETATTITLTEVGGYFNSLRKVEIPEPPISVVSNPLPSSECALAPYANSGPITWDIVPDTSNLYDIDITVETLYLMFEEFELGAGAVLEFYDESANLVIQLTDANNANYPDRVVINSGTGSVVFNPNGSAGTARGFGIYYFAGACPWGVMTFTSSNGTLEDGSGSNNPYVNRRECGFLIESPDESGLITITFDGEIEQAFDFINVYDGADRSARLIAALTGEMQNVVLKSTTNQLFFSWRSDKTINETGWTAQYQIDVDQYCTNNGLTTFTQPSDFFSDRSSISTYQQGECEWLIQSSENVSFVALYFAELDIADDKIRVYEGTDDSGALLAEIKGNTIPPPVTINSPDMYMVFDASNNNIVGQGFVAVYHAGGCQGNVFVAQNAGIISDGSGNGTYPDLQSCQWLIRLDGDNFKDISYEFERFDTEFTYDIVIIYDGDSTTDPRLLVWTGNQLPVSGKTSGPEMLIRFITDQDTVGRGWELRYTGNRFPPIPFEAVEYSDPAPIVLIVLLMLTAIVVVLVGAFVAAFWRDKVFQTTGLPFNFFTLVTLFFACFALFPFIGEPTDGLCAWRPWAVLAAVAVYGNIVAKVAAIWAQWQTRSKQDKESLIEPKYPFYVMLPAVAALLFVELVYLVIWTAVDAPVPDRSDTDTGDEEHDRCQSDHHVVWIAIQMSMLGGLALVGVVAAFFAYRVHTLWNESKFLSLTVFFVTVISIVFVVVAYVVIDIPDAWIVLIGTGIWLNVMIVLGLNFAPKMYTVLKMRIKSAGKGAGIDDKWDSAESGSAIENRNAISTQQIAPDNLDNL